MPNKFWAADVKCADYPLNRATTITVQDTTPQKAWGSFEPYVRHS